MILYANDGRIVFSEVIGLGVCMGILFLIGLLFFLIYRATVRSLKRILQIGSQGSK